MTVDITKLEESLERLVSNADKSDFIYSLLDVYGFPRATITLLKRDPSRLSKKSNEIVLRNKVIFHVLAANEDEHLVIDGLLHDKAATTHRARFIIVTNFDAFLAIDTLTKETLDIPFTKLSKYYTFFLPWTGREKYRGENENPADIKAAAKMATLYDRLIADNPDYAKDNAHELNLFLTRLLFCFFAEDSGIFPESLFSNSVISHTAEDGHDFRQYLEGVFNVLNIEESKRVDIPEHLKQFPYVNGGLFNERIQLPDFSRKSRAIVVETSKLNWSQINPDIFGSMIQAVTHPGMREDLGMHYTSVSNILKLINPLFLDGLKDELNQASDNVKRLTELRDRITKIRVFDPACGSGNFLIVSYKKLCELEIEIINRIQSAGTDVMPLSGISLNSFYGIEIDDFAREIARLSLWLAQHQMNRYFNDVFGFAKPTLPLKEAGKIEHANAARIKWSDVCPKVDEKGQALELYVIGNPPYQGFLQQKKQQKEDMKMVLLEMGSYKKLDYVSCWFWLAAKYIENSSIQVAFVSTNSITQGEQTTLLWKPIFHKNIEIGFAHQSFKWQNLAKKNAGVTCVIVSLRNISNNKKYLYLTDGGVKEVDNINAYLASGPNIFVEKRSKPLSSFPRIDLGGSAYDGGHLMLTKQERDEFVRNNPESKKYIRRFMGSAEFIRGIERYCIWIDDKQISEAEKITDIKNRLELVKKFRLSSERGKTYETASTPYKFTEYRYKDAPAIIAPIISSEAREYIPFDFIERGVVVPNSARIIYNAPPYILGIMLSRMHMTWVRAVAGRLKTDIRYSGTICYNTFPFPSITEEQKKQITNHVSNVLEEREKYPDQTIATLYSPEKMPLGLRQAHEFLDEVIDQIYQKKPFRSDEERLACLFKLYKEMLTNEEK